MSVQVAPLLRGSATQSTAVDNAASTATLAATEGVKRLILGVEAQFDVGVTAIVNLTLNVAASEVKNWEWDFTNGPFIYNLPVALAGADSGAVSATVAASGAGGTTGYVTLFTATK